MIKYEEWFAFQEGILRVYLPAELDHFITKDIREGIWRFEQEYRIKEIIFDFARCVLMDSSGIGLIAGRYRELSMQGGSVYVSHVPEAMRKILTISGLWRIAKEIDEEGKGEE